ncbi:unnamed protein product [Knipowitschia caucasica]
MDPNCPAMKIIFLLWLGSGPAQSIVFHQYLWYKPFPRTWMDAQESCKREDQQLAVMSDEVNQMNLKHFYAWIGLRKNGSNWYWDSGHDVLQDIQDNFDPPNGGQPCGQAFYETPTPSDDDCTNRHFFFCRETLPYGVWSYIFVPQTKTWEEAKAYCVEQNYRFITIRHNDLHWVYSPFYVQRNFPVWIGQYHHGSGDCGLVWSKDKVLSHQNCSEAFPSLCAKSNVLLVQELLTWEQSFHRCRSHNNSFNSLLSGNTQELKSFQNAASNATTEKVWLGLRFIGGSWFWSDGADLTLPDLPSCPEPNRHCGALQLNRNSNSEPVIVLSDCSEMLNTFCYTL